MSEYVKTCKVKDGDKDENNKLMFSRIDDDELLKNIKPNTYYYNLKFSLFKLVRKWCRIWIFKFISIDSLLVYKKNIINKYI